MVQQIGQPSKKTLAVYAPEVIAQRRTGGLKPTTLANYERYVAQDIVPSRLGPMLLTDIRRAHVNGWVADVAATAGGEAEAAQEAWVSDGHVFTMKDGRALDPAYITREFQKIRTQGEPLPELTFHGLRHSAASLMLAGGADISQSRMWPPPHEDQLRSGTKA